MSLQLSIFDAIQAHDAGINLAVSHADAICEGWSDLASDFLLEYIKTHSVFMAEEVRIASEWVVPEPPHTRSWGAIFVRASKAGYIKRIGYKQTNNPKAHRTPATLWERC